MKQLPVYEFDGFWYGQRAKSLPLALIYKGENKKPILIVLDSLSHKNNKKKKIQRNLCILPIRFGLIKYGVCVFMFQWSEIEFIVPLIHFLTARELHEFILNLRFHCCHFNFSLIENIYRQLSRAGFPLINSVCTRKWWLILFWHFDKWGTK